MQTLAILANIYKAYKYLQGLPAQKSLLEVYNVGFLIWVFVDCQSRVRIPGFLANVCIVMVYITLFFFHAFADVFTCLGTMFSEIFHVLRFN